MRCYASVPDRAAALLLDGVAISLLAFVVAAAAAVVIGPAVRLHPEADAIDAAVEVNRGVAVLDAVLAGVVGAVYLVRGWRRGASPGQRLIGIAVADRRAHDRPPAIGAAVLRWAVLAGPFAVVAVLVVAVPSGRAAGDLAVVAWALVLLASTVRDRDRRGLHDRAAGTIVTSVGRPVPVPGTATPERRAG